MLADALTNGRVRITNTHDGPSLVLTLDQDLGKGQVRMSLEHAETNTGQELKKAGDSVTIEHGKSYVMNVTDASSLDAIAFSLSGKNGKGIKVHVHLTAILDPKPQGKENLHKIKKFICESYVPDSSLKARSSKNPEHMDWFKVFLPRALEDGNLTIVNSNLGLLEH